MLEPELHAETEFMSMHIIYMGHFSASNCWSVPLWKGLLHPCLHPYPRASWQIQIHEHQYVVDYGKIGYQQQASAEQFKSKSTGKLRPHVNLALASFTEGKRGKLCISGSLKDLCLKFRAIWRQSDLASLQKNT